MYSIMEVVVMVELKPCPFCGGEAVLEGTYITRTWQAYEIYCKNQNCLGHYINQGFNSEKEAARAWNKRAGE